jgi:hypothetical protein
MITQIKIKTRDGFVLLFSDNTYIEVIEVTLHA